MARCAQTARFCFVLSSPPEASDKTGVGLTTPAVGLSDGRHRYNATVNRLFWRAGGLAKIQWARLRRRRLSDDYETRPPSPQHALDLFAGEWSSALPPGHEGLTAGAIPLYADRWLHWGLERLGGVRDQRVLELGPLEGAHSWLLVSQGAASVTAIEANRRAYLKCLVMKEILGTERVRVLLGDAVGFLAGHVADPAAPRYDLAVASGVLYHMADPITLLSRLAKAADRLYLFTFYYDEAVIAGRPQLAARFLGTEARTVDGFPHRLHVHTYQAARYDPRFCGGPAAVSRWLSRADLLGALRHVGFADVEIGLDDPAHANGPVLALVARRGGAAPLPIR